MNTRRRYRLTPLLLTLGLMFFGASALASGPLPAFDTVYAIKGFGLKIGEFSSALAIDADKNYSYSTRTQTTGFIARLHKDLIKERSQWLWHGTTIRPLTYTYDRRGGAKQKQARLTFDWNKLIVENTINGETWRMPIKDGVLDRLVVQLSMMLDLKNGKRDMVYTFADGGKLKSYRFRIIGEERLETPAGSYDTVKLERVMNNSKRSTLLWCAPKLHYLPVRIDQREEDDNYSMLLESYTEH